MFIERQNETFSTCTTNGGAAWTGSFTEDAFLETASPTPSSYFVLRERRTGAGIYD